MVATALVLGLPVEHRESTRVGGVGAQQAVHVAAPLQGQGLGRIDIVGDDCLEPRGSPDLENVVGAWARDRHGGWLVRHSRQLSSELGVARVAGGDPQLSRPVAARHPDCPGLAGPQHHRQVVVNHGPPLALDLDTRHLNGCVALAKDQDLLVADATDHAEVEQFAREAYRRGALLFEGLRDDTGVLWRDLGPLVARKVVVRTRTQERCAEKTGGVAGQHGCSSGFRPATILLHKPSHRRAQGMERSRCSVTGA